MTCIIRPNKDYSTLGIGKGIQAHHPVLLQPTADFAFRRDGSGCDRANPMTRLKYAYLSNFVRIKLCFWRIATPVLIFIKKNTSSDFRKLFRSKFGIKF